MAVAAAFSALLIAATQAVLLDRLAATAGNESITLGQVLDEIRIVAFVNGEKPDFSPASRRRAAERLVDQALIRREMRISQYPEPTPEEAEKALEEFKRKRFPDEKAFQQALEDYEIPEGYLLAHLRWEIAILRFTDYRFHLMAGAGKQAEAGEEVDGQMEAWLKQARATTRIRFFEEAFR